MGKALAVCFVLFMGLVALSIDKAQSPKNRPQVHFDSDEQASRCADPAACRRANEVAYKNVAQNTKKEAEYRRKEMEVSEQRAIIAVTKRAVASSLRDPSSAIFGQVFYARKKKGDAVCGEVNARNGFGGYTGMQPFVVTIPEGTLYLNSVSQWNSRCAN